MATCPNLHFPRGHVLEFTLPFQKPRYFTGNFLLEAVCGVRSSLLLAAVAISTPVTAGSLTEARVAHKAAVARLREKLLADMNEIIRKEHDRGAGIDYLLKDKKGFEENGVLPLLPKFQPAAREYQIGKRKTDEQLAKAIEVELAKVTGEESRRLRNELAELRPAKSTECTTEDTTKKPSVESQGTLSVFLVNTKWSWHKGGELTFKPNGVVHHTEWSAITTRWEASGRRTVKLTILKGPTAGHTGLTMTLTLDEELSSFAGKDFDGSETGVGHLKK